MIDNLDATSDRIVRGAAGALVGGRLAGIG